MSTTYHTIKGRSKWSRVYEPDTYANAERYKIDVYFFDDEELKKFKKSGAAVKIKEDDDGKYVTLRRMTSKVFKANKERKEDQHTVFLPPEISGAFNVYYTDQNGKRIQQYVKDTGVEVERVGDPINIGNGSVIEVNYAVYNAGDLKGHRLEKIKVLDLVEFIDNKVEEEVEVPEEEVKVVAKDKPKITTTKAPTFHEDLDDDLPF